MIKTKPIYLVWDEGDGDIDSGYWELFSSVPEAVDCKGAGVEVFFARPRRLGTFKRKSVCVRIKTLKKKKAIK